MIYRTRSFNINNHNDFSLNPLRRTQSASNMRSVDAELSNLRDLRRVIRINKGDHQEAFSAVNTILIKMNEEQLLYDFFKDNFNNEPREKNVGETFRSKFPNLNNILKNHGLLKQDKTKEEIENTEEIKKNFFRYQNSKTIFTSIRQSINSSHGEDVFFIAYYFNNPIGILRFSKKTNIPTVVHFAIHYLIRNCGYLLMEYAVKESVDLGKEGKLQIDALPRAEKAYFDMGFFKTVGDVMILEPSMSDKWSMINSCYKYTRC
ncbi:GNAT family N-acetyltransferase [Xenorhabdus lircayensis]|uniref:GNAT family N-acetyltransferase n=1 Tax=Xenorhabdus lircayensis TaxID=2763499 RepID=A0ABS0U1L2_9GAMM|nr:GNAT family N-acetyltransferase [Xenorhabdus lircayensis]MBI6547774.1 GNAT family N-acetyltransferase [Xenorhabdus lircayensis]